jgi:hypothetical protein
VKNVLIVENPAEAIHSMMQILFEATGKFFALEA